MTADRARGALAVLQDADGKFICEVPCGYIVEQTASAHKPRRIQAQRRRRAMLCRRVALTVALLTVAALLAALMPWSGSGAADKPKDTTAGTLEEVHQPTAALLPSSGTVAGKPPSASTVNIKSHERSYSIMFSKKKTECRVCGYRFTPERENIYTAEEPRSALEMLTAAPTRFSAVDCPICGCQIRLAERAPRIDLPAITEQHDADAEETEGGEDED